MYVMASKSTIYLVDDDISVRRGLARLIRSEGFEVKAFASAGEFLEQKDLEPTGCLIVDAKMPGLTGLDLQKRLTDAGISIPVIFVTAHDDPETRNLAKERGAVGFFHKPVDAQALLDSIRWALGDPGEGQEIINH